MKQMEEILEMIKAAKYLIELYTNYVERGLNQLEEEEKFQHDEELMESTSTEECFDWEFTHGNM